MRAVDVRGYRRVLTKPITIPVTTTAVPIAVSARCRVRFPVELAATNSSLTAQIKELKKRHRQDVQTLRNALEKSPR